MSKGMGSEFCNQNAYDAIQIHGGSGFMKDYACERIYRDARITSIYEGTTQLQVVAAIRHVTTGTYLEQINDYAALEYAPALKPLQDKLAAMTKLYSEAVEKVVSQKNPEYDDFHARRLVEMAGHIIMGYLLLGDANRTPELFTKSANVYVRYGEAEIARHHKFIMEFNEQDFADSYKAE
jgi:hypothetical protein